MDDKKVPKSSKHFYCINCDYITSRYSQYERHILTSKHKESYVGLRQRDKKVPKKGYIYICDCGKEYKYRQGLWKHKKICCNIEEKQNISDNLFQTGDNNIINDNYLSKDEIIFMLIKENKEFKELLLEQNKHLIELAKDKSITNNSHNITNNTHFNLQLFLNETCKNAMNINDFIDKIQVNLSDLENTARLGYVEGISRIFIKGLKELEMNERPIHCSDGKRETLYIKDGDIWEKDDINKTKLTNAIRKIANKNMRMITEWKKQHPHCQEYDSNKNDLYLKIVSNSMCGGTEEETENNYNKIRKNIIKEVIIDK
jgi:hypothetical protein